MSVTIVYIIIIVSILAIFSILWHDFWTPVLLNGLKLKILYEKEIIIDYCRKNNINKKIKKELIELSDTIFYKMEYTSLIMFLIFSLKQNKKTDINKNTKLNKLFNSIKNEEYIKYLYNRIDNLFTYSLMYMVFSSILFTMFFCLYSIFNILSNKLKYSVNNIIKDLFKLFNIADSDILNVMEDINDKKVILNN